MNYRTDLEAAAARLKLLARNYSTAVAVNNYHEAKRMLRMMIDEARNAEQLAIATITDQQNHLAGRLENAELTKNAAH